MDTLECRSSSLSCNEYPSTVTLRSLPRPLLIRDSYVKIHRNCQLSKIIKCKGFLFILLYLDFYLYLFWLFRLLYNVTKLRMFLNFLRVTTYKIPFFIL